MGFRKQCRQIAKLCVAQLRGEQVMDLETIVNSLEMWMVNVPDDPDERMLCHLIQSAPGEFAMHREWVNNLYRERYSFFKCPIAFAVRYDHWRQRASILAMNAWRLKMMADDPIDSVIEERWWLKGSVMAGIEKTRQRIVCDNVAAAHLHWGAQALRRQNVLLFRDLLLYWEAWARLIRR